MPIDLSKVVWTVSNIPAGLSFNTKTGTFTGTPTEVGEYTVSVSVNNGYGTDAKDVSIVVESAPVVYDEKMFVVPVRELRIDLHYYFEKLGAEEYISLSDAGVTSCEYAFGSSLWTDRKYSQEECYIEKPSGVKIFFDYDVNTGEIVATIPENWGTTNKDKGVSLDIKTNLGRTVCFLTLTTSTTASKTIYDW